MSCFSGWGLDAKSELPKTSYQEIRKDIFCKIRVILYVAFLSAINSDKDRHEVESADQSDNVVEKTISSDNESLLPNVSDMLLKDKLATLPEFGHGNRAILPGCVLGNRAMLSIMTLPGFKDTIWKRCPVSKDMIWKHCPVSKDTIGKHCPFFMAKFMKHSQFIMCKIRKRCHLLKET